MGQSKELFAKLNHEDSALEFYSRLNLLKEMQEELVDPKVPESVKRIILKTVLA